MSKYKNKDPDSGEYVKRSAGRPKLSEGSVRTIVKKFRVNPMENLNIQTSFGKSRKKKESDYLRDVTQFGKIFAIASPEELQLGREYAGALNNLSQLLPWGINTVCPSSSKTRSWKWSVFLKQDWKSSTIHTAS